MADNPRVTSSALFFSKLNQANPQEIPYDATNVTVGTPQAADDPSKNKNSMVQVTGVAGGPYSNMRWMYYDRVPMQAIADTVAGGSTFHLTDETMISDVLPAFNQVFNVNVVAADIIDGPLPAANGSSGQVSFNLAASAGSLAFSGTTPLIFKPDDISLTTLATTTLTGLTPAYINAG